MALIEFVAADDTGYRKRRKAAQPKAESAAEAPASEATAPAAAPAP
jgi:hypothetical protein